MSFIVLSPHRDDAAFSCGVLIAAALSAGEQVTILNIFTESNYAPFAEVATVRDVSALRKEEDVALQRLAGPALSIVDLDLLDAPLRLSIPADATLSQLDEEAYELQVKQIEEVLLPFRTGAEFILAPLALGGHIDHRIVHDAVLRRSSFDCVAFYEDLPYAARLHQHQRNEAVDALGSIWNGEIASVTLQHEASARIKREYGSCYRSQVDQETVEEMAGYSGIRGGESFFAGKVAASAIAKITHALAEGAGVR